MESLVLTNEQLQQLQTAGFRAMLVDAQGRLVGVASPPLFTEEEIAEARRRLASNQRRYTVAEKNEKIAQIVAEIEAANDAV